MNLSFLYTPVLKCKGGEISALGDISDETKLNIVPLFEAVPEVLPADRPPRKPQPIKPGAKPRKPRSPSPFMPVSKKVKAIAKKWGVGRPIYLDGKHLPEEFAGQEGIYNIGQFFSIGREAGVAWIPVTGLERKPAYQAVVKEAISVDRRGFMIRLELKDGLLLSNASLREKLLKLCQSMECVPEEVDIQIDLQAFDLSSEELAGVENSILDNIPLLKRWRRVIVSATSFPKDLTNHKVPKGKSSTIHRIPRREWEAWNLLRPMREGKRIPIFSDYAIAHSDCPPPANRKLSVSANIRYAGLTEWVVARGKALDLEGFDQYYDLSSNLILQPEYSGASFSRADGEIKKTAERQTSSPGSPRVWRRIGTDRHLTLTVNQVANLHVS